MTFLAFLVAKYLRIILATHYLFYIYTIFRSDIKVRVESGRSDVVLPRGGARLPRGQPVPHGGARRGRDAGHLRVHAARQHAAHSLPHRHRAARNAGGRHVPRPGPPW